MTHPPETWPNVLVPLPVRFTFDPSGSLYFDVMNLPEGDRTNQYINTARDLFLPRVAVLNGEGMDLRGRTPEVLTVLPDLDEVAEEVRRWLT